MRDHPSTTPRAEAYMPCPPIERLSVDLVRAQAAVLPKDMADVLAAIPAAILVLNEARQVIFANPAAHELCGDHLSDVVGLRPGEVLGCLYAGAGCGLGESCAACGNARALWRCEQGESASDECRIPLPSGKALDLRVTARPVPGHPGLMLLTLVDVSHEKRRAALERAFFHDLLNTVGAVSGYAQLLPVVAAHERSGMAETIAAMAETLAEEIRAQRDLQAAESDDLQVRKEELYSLAILTQAMELYRHHEAASGRKLALAPDCANVPFESDRLLVRRILGNMIKNALEAAEPGQTITVGCRVAGPMAEFFVHNPSTMQRTVQLQVFQRSFSTKGPGRGIGTYAIKLFAERYLGGRTWFTSSAATGTTFYVSLPCAPTTQPS